MSVATFAFVEAREENDPVPEHGSVLRSTSNVDSFVELSVHDSTALAAKAGAEYIETASSNSKATNPRIRHPLSQIANQRSGLAANVDQAWRNLAVDLALAERSQHRVRIGREPRSLVLGQAAIPDRTSKNRPGHAD